MGNSSVDRRVAWRVGGNCTKVSIDGFVVGGVDVMVGRVYREMGSQNKNTLFVSKNAHFVSFLKLCIFLCHDTIYDIMGYYKCHK